MGVVTWGGSGVAGGFPLAPALPAAYPSPMIRHRRGDHFFLITQHDHAQLSGRFAERVGNGDFVRPEPFRETVDGVALHDCGWPLHDDKAPTLNSEGLPLHVLESPMPVATRVWSESARLAAEHHPYTGLLVSLHVLALSTFAQSRDPTRSPALHRRLLPPARPSAGRPQ